MRRALVFGAGMLRTGFDAGVAASLCRTLGPDYFNEVIASSGSVFGASFFVAKQPDTMLKVWRHGVDSGQLLHWSKPLLGSKILDLDYLVQKFQSTGDYLDLDAIFTIPTKLVYVLTNYETGKPIYARPRRHNIWDLQRGSCAVPVIYGPVTTEYGRLIDGGLSDALPVQYALDQGHDEVVVVYNRPENYVSSRKEDWFCRLVGSFLPAQLRRLLETFEERMRETEKLFSDSRVKLIRAPSHSFSASDDHKGRLNALIDLGELAATEQYLKQLLSRPHDLS